MTDTAPEERPDVADAIEALASAASDEEALALERDLLEATDNGPRPTDPA